MTNPGSSRSQGPPAPSRASPARGRPLRAGRRGPCARALPRPTFAPFPSWGAVPSAPSPRETNQIVTHRSQRTPCAHRTLQTHMKGPAHASRGLRSESVTHRNNTRDKRSQFSALHRSVCEVPANHTLRPHWDQSKRQHFPRRTFARSQPRWNTRSARGGLTSECAAATSGDRTGTPG